MTDNNNELYTVREVADRLKLHRNTVIRMILTQRLSATFMGKSYRISEAQIQEFMERNTLQSK